jgi:hypothetical protein
MRRAWAPGRSLIMVGVALYSLLSALRHSDRYDCYAGRYDRDAGRKDWCRAHGSCSRGGRAPRWAGTRRQEGAAQGSYVTPKYP